MNSKSCAYFYDDHTSQLFKLVNLKPALDRDKGVMAHRHNYFEIFIFKQGGGQHLIDFNEYNVQKNSVHFVPPGSVHLLRRDENTKGFVLLLSRDFIHLMGNQQFYLASKPQEPVLSLDPPVFEKLERHLLLIQEEIQTEQNYTTDIIAHYLNIVLISFQRLFEQDKTTPNATQDHLFQKFQLLLENEFSELQQVGDYAQKLHVAPEVLNQVCKQKMGKTVVMCIQERLLLEAKRMLFHSDMTSKEIAYALNFNDPAYFGRFFKRKTQQSPQVFRKTIREKYHVLSEKS